MIDLDIKYPSEFDILPVTTQVSINIGQNINALRDSILNLQQVLGLNVNIGLFTPNPEDATVSDRLDRIERGIAERNLVFEQINVSDSLSVFLNQNNEPFVKIGRGEPDKVAPVTILGPLTILSPSITNPETLIQTPVRIDITTIDKNKSTKSSIKGKSNFDEPLLTIQDINESSFLENNPDSVALKVSGNMIVTGILQAEFSIDHEKLLNIETVPTEETRGIVRHITQGDYHSHRKNRYDNTNDRWIVDSSTSSEDFGIIRHSDLEGIGTLPTDKNSFIPTPDVAYHVTGGDQHTHSAGDGARLNHEDLLNISPFYSNHVQNGNGHRHSEDGDGARISHQDLLDIDTSETDSIHVPQGGRHAHQIDEDGNPVGNGSQINHIHLSGIETTGTGAVHVTDGDQHTHNGQESGGGKINHTNLLNIGQLTHEEIDTKINTFRALDSGTITITSDTFDEVQISHKLGTDQFRVMWSLVSRNTTPPSDIDDIGVIYISDHTSSTFKLNRIGGIIPGPATKATLTTGFTNQSNLTFISRAAGISGNDISIEYRDDVNALESGIYLKVIAVTFPASITVIFDGSQPPLNISGNATKTAILNDPTASILVDVIGVSGESGNDAIKEFGPENLADGYDSQNFLGLEVD